jgi:hypothetical protein
MADKVRVGVPWRALLRRRLTPEPGVAPFPRATVVFGSQTHRTFLDNALFR